MKKFIVAKLLDFKIKMIDNKAIVTQVHEVQVIIHDILDAGIKLYNTFVEHINFVLSTHITFHVGLIANDALQVAAAIKKLPPLWKKYKNFLEHKLNDITI